MSALKVIVVTLLAGSLSIGLALLGERWIGGDGTGTASPRADARRQRIESLPDIRLPNLDGDEVASSSWAGKVVVLNYWASWCAPCLREMPMLAELHQTYANRGLQIVGIAIDQREKVAQFVERNAIDYPILLGGEEAIALSRRLCNRTGGLPFTAIFDRYGQRVFARVGELSADMLRRELLPLLSGAG